MEKRFWLERWQRGEIGFHRDSVHPALERYWPQVAGAARDPVLVPLCGKSLDMRWLAARGHPVVGIELDHGAIEAFFREAGTQPTLDDTGPLPRWSADGITLYGVDFFEFSPASRFRLVYDRAALIALPPEMRPAYLDRLAWLLSDDARGLLITLEYDQQAMQGPPFSVLEEELEAHPAFDFECLDRADVLASHPRFAERGLAWLNEVAYAL